MKSSSKVLQETVVEKDDGRTVYYGRWGDVLRITVKGAFTPAVEMGQTESELAAQSADKSMRKSIVEAVESMGYKRNIVETDITTMALKVGKVAKMRCTVYIAPTQEEGEQDTVEEVVEAARIAAKDALERHGFELSTQRERSRGKGKKVKHSTLRKK